MDEGTSPQEPGNFANRVEFLKEAFDRHEQALETFSQSQNQFIKDLRNQISALNLESIQSSGSSTAAVLPPVNQRIGKSSAKQSEEIKRPHRRICKLRQLEGRDQIKKLNETHIRFGPIYSSKENSSPNEEAWEHVLKNKENSSAKEEAWEHVLKNTPGGAAATSETYMSAMRKIEIQARDCYDDPAVDSLAGSQFRRMMLLDGCFFLQLALCILGGAQQLRYPANHAIFGRNHERFGDVKEWIEAMFFVGNQIPLVVLKQLIEQSFFQDVIKEGKWKQPSRLSSRAFYELLLLPELLAQSPKMWRAIKGRWGKRFDPRTYWMLQQKPNDFLHGLQLLVLGPETREAEKEEEEEDQDLEAQHEEGDSLGPTDNKTSSSATELNQTGIHFSVSHRIGCRGIHFTNSMFFCHGYAILHLPPISMDDDTKMVFHCLGNYEISQKLSMSKREICSYIRFMSELIQMPGDAKLMANNKIIKGEPKHRHKLPGILRRLASKDTYDQNLRMVKLKIGEYSEPIWKRYWHIISLGLILTVLQTVYTILPYYRGS